MLRAALLLSLFFASSVFAAESKSNLKTPPDWKVEVVAQPPELKWPSVVEAAPDGRIFVAEDPMDMPGPAQVPADRILCIFPDGHITVFADKLYAVFGLRYIDGKLIVHHTPKLSVFTDDHGVGKGRVDLYDSDNPNPAPGFNDHIPSNIRLGMDGFLYMSTGDKGVYGAKSNVDGKTAEIHGGGVLRIRPDGRDMEVYSTGTRNHLDVAVNDEDELFTYDNTDDGQGWWTRYTHMIDGGYYGYPYDYKTPAQPDDDKRDHEHPFQPYTLWRMAEYGGGSPTGATGYNEDALPEEYHGNTFNCEWGKGRFERFVIARDGGTYKVVKLQTMIEGQGFRPVGCSVTADGKGLLVTDWEYGGWSRPDVHGRLLRLTYTGAMQPAPRPAWYVPAAQGEKFDASTSDLIAALAHPAEAVRLVAQRRLADRGKEAIEPLQAVLKDNQQSALAKRHAIWALDAIDGGVAARPTIIAVARDAQAEASVRRQAIRQLGTRRAAEATGALEPLLKDPDASIRERAAIALGRIGDRSAVGQLLAALPESDLFVHYSLFTALNRIGRADPAAWPYIVEGLRNSDQKVREGTVLALHETYQKPLVEALASLAADSSAPADARVLALESIAPLHRQRPHWTGDWWGTQPAGSLPPEKSVEWEGTSIVLKTISAALADQNPEVRNAAIAAVSIAPDPSATSALAMLFQRTPDDATRKAILKAFASSKAPEAVQLIQEVLRHGSEHPALVPTAITTAQAIGSPQAIATLIDYVSVTPAPGETTQAYDALAALHAREAVEAISHGLSGDENLAIAAAGTLGRIGGESAGKALVGALNEKRPSVRHAIIAAIGLAKDPSAAPALLALLKNEQDRLDATAALTRTPDARAVDAYLDGLSNADAGLRDQCRRALTEVAVEVRPHIEQRITNEPSFPSSAVDELRKIYVKPQPIVEWDIVGPFAMDAAPPFPLDALPPKGQFTGYGNKPAKWVHLSNGDAGRFNITSTFEDFEHVCAFAVAEIDSPSDTETTLTGGSDDGLVLYLNGQKVHEDTSEHGYTADSYSVKGHLKAGKNILIARTINAGGGWEFSVAVSTPGAGPIFNRETSPNGPASYASFAASHEGDATRGSTLFHNASGLGCIKCHTVGNEGGIVGPNLSSIGRKYEKAKLIEDVLYPSKQIESGYEQTIIRTKDGDVESGIVKSESDAELTMYDSAARKIVIRKADIKQRRISRISVMPEGLQAGLTHEQFADLIAYLQSLRETEKK